LFAELLAVAVEAARAGGAVLIDGRARPKHVALKSERSSIVTAVDVAAQSEVLAIIGRHFPDHAVRAEEGDGVDRPEADHTWLVDPLDGTSNYAHGIPFACTSVAVCDRYGPVAGAVYEPFRDELFTATRGGGAWLGAERLAVSATADVAHALVATGLQSDVPEHIAAFGRRVVALSTHCRGVRCIGSPALCLAYVAAGRLDAFLERDATYAWDVGAGALMISEAGGVVEDLDGGPPNFGPGLANVLATNGLVHATVGAVIRAAEAS
jgi:myo-inositol-1(or 4)-monophosphatase